MLFTIMAFSAAQAQEETTTDAPPRNFNQERRPNLLAELDLTRSQIQQIRRINADNKILRRDAQQKLREANRELDRAIYADNADETEIQNRLKDVQNAQAEVFKLKAATEYAIRKVLTPDQLIRFREIRQSFMERIEALKPQNNRPLNAPNQKLLNRRRMRNNN